MEQAKIDRINVLAKKKKAEGLTEAELAEQAELRKEFLAAIRADLKASLDSIEYVEDQTGDPQEAETVHGEIEEIEEKIEKVIEEVQN